MFEYLLNEKPLLCGLVLAFAVFALLVWSSGD